MLLYNVSGKGRHINMYYLYPRPQSDINKMHMSNIAIVFCPTLQISAPLFHLIFNNAQEIFGEVEIRKLVIINVCT